MFGPIAFEELAELYRSAKVAVALAVKGTSPSRIVTKSTRYGSAQTVSPHCFQELITATDCLSIGRESFRAPAYALNAISCTFSQQSENKNIRALFDAHADRLTKKASSWLGHEREGYNWAAENFFIRALPLMNAHQFDSALDAIAHRYEELEKEQAGMRYALVRDRYDDLLTADVNLHERMQKFEGFVQRLNLPTLQPNT